MNHIPIMHDPSPRAAHSRSGSTSILVIFLLVLFGVAAIGWQIFGDSPVQKPSIAFRPGEADCGSVNLGSAWFAESGAERTSMDCFERALVECSPAVLGMEDGYMRVMGASPEGCSVFHHYEAGLPSLTCFLTDAAAAGFQAAAADQVAISGDEEGAWRAWHPVMDGVMNDESGQRPGGLKCVRS